MMQRRKTQKAAGAPAHWRLRLYVAVARSDQIIAIPTLVRKLPPPIRKIIGDLSNQDSVIAGLNIEAAPPQGQA